MDLFTTKTFLQKLKNPDEIKTFEQLTQVAQKLDSMKDELEIEAVFAYPAKET